MAVKCCSFQPARQPRQPEPKPARVAIRGSGKRRQGGALKDAQEEVPLYAVSGLQALSHRAATREVPEIAEFLPAFAGLCEVAGRRAVHQAVPALLQWAQGSDRYAASAALVALARLGAGQARELLLKNLRKPATSRETREALAVGLGRISEPEVGPALTEVLGMCNFAEEAGLVRSF